MEKAIPADSFCLHTPTINPIIVIPMHGPRKVPGPVFGLASFPRESREKPPSIGVIVKMRFMPSFFIRPRPKRATAALVLLGLSLVFFHTVQGAAQTNRQRVFVIPVSGEVEPTMAAFIERAVQQTAQYPDALLIFEMDTFGGRVDAALNIVETLLHTGSRKTVAFVKTKAISAGALIALACNDLVMRPSTTIGDCAPITYSGEGPKMMGEKFQSPLRAKFRSLARRNHYPPTLAEAMVTDGHGSIRCNHQRQNPLSGQTGI